MPFSMKVRLSNLVIDTDLNMLGRNVQNVGTLYGNKEVIEVEETLAKQTIRPTAGGAVALVIRDVSNSVDRVVIKEDGTAEVREISVGDIKFSNGCYLTEVDGGIALMSPRGQVIKVWKEDK